MAIVYGLRLYVWDTVYGLCIIPLWYCILGAVAFMADIHRWIWPLRWARKKAFLKDITYTGRGVSIAR
jgi:hypothetical protein